MRRPKLTAEMDKIELDQVSVLVEIIHKTFKEAYGAHPNPNDWDSVRIQQEMSDLFSPAEFNRLFATELGKGVIVGAWLTEYILHNEPEDSFLDELF